MRAIVCGGREYSDEATLFAALDSIKPALVIQGGAPGADRLALKWCHSRCIECWNMPADWKKHGKAAGPIRNQRMIDEGKPSLVIAFPGGRGTENMVQLAERAGIPVIYGATI